VRTVVTLLCVGGLSACTSVEKAEPDEPAWQSGPRMRATKLVAADGFETITGWWDSELAMDCTGPRRSPEVCGAVGRVLGHYYADGSCTDLVIRLETSAHFAWGTDVVNDQTVGYEVGDPWTGSTAYAKFDGDRCLTVQPYPLMFHATVTTALAVAHWEPVSSQVTRHVWSDGAYQLMPALRSSNTRLRGSMGTIIDTARDREYCVPTEVGGEVRCLPPADSPLFEDPLCSVPLDRTFQQTPVLAIDHLVYPTTESSLASFWWKYPTVPGGDPVCQKYPSERATYVGRRVELDEFVELFPAVE